MIFAGLRPNSKRFERDRTFYAKEPVRVENAREERLRKEPIQSSESLAAMQPVLLSQKQLSSRFSFFHAKFRPFSTELSRLKRDFSALDSKSFYLEQRALFSSFLASLPIDAQTKSKVFIDANAKRGAVKSDKTREKAFRRRSRSGLQEKSRLFWLRYGRKGELTRPRAI